jgi:ComF family protein
MPLERAGERVCPNCWGALELLSPEARLSKKLPPSLDEIHPVYVFEEKIQKIIHALKYQGYRSLGLRLGELVGKQLFDKIHREANISLVPIPLHPIKLRERGYNQAALIARGISLVTHTPVEEKIIRRIKNTKTQTQLSAAERQENMAGAFALGKRSLIRPDQTIILVDDVLTTGATLSAAATILRQSGIGQIIGVTVATPLMVE